MKPKTLALYDAPHRGDPHDLKENVLSREDSIDLTVANDYDKALAAIESVEILITRQDLKSGVPELLEAGTELKWIQGLSAGYNKYDVETLEERDIILTTASGVHANPIAEQVLGYLLLFERKLLKGIDQQSRNEWRHYTAGELNGKTLGIIGVGEIGGKIAELGSAFDMDVLGTKRDTADVNDAVDQIYNEDEYHTVIGKSDYVVVACPLTEKTRGLIGSTELESMKPSSVLVNIARGAIVDEDDLLNSLQKGQIRGAALDVQSTEPLPPDSPLWNLSNVIITPHMAGATPEYLERCADIFVENYESFVDGNENSMMNRIV